MKILRTMLLALILIFSIGAISASDVNMTDSDTLDLSDENEIESSNDLESVNSNTLSTNNDDVSLQDVVKNQTELTSPTTTTYYKGSFSVTLKDSSSNVALANKNVNFVIDNVNYNTTTDDSGVASINLRLMPGKYSVTSYFAGDDAYTPSNNLTTALEVLSTIKANDVTTYYKGSTQYSATFLDSHGNVLANREVTITVNGKSNVVKTDGNGVASLPMDYKPGTYKVVSTDPTTGYELTTTFKILSTISGSNTYNVAGTNKKFTVKFLKSNGAPLAKQTVKFKLNGKTYKVKTDKKGKASISLKKLKKGTYKVVCYNKDGLTKTFKIKVYKKATTKVTTKFYTFLKSDSKKVKVTLTNSLSHNVLSGKKVKMTINGKSYYKKTNKKGVATFKLPSLKRGIHTIKYKFSGSGYYQKSSVSNKVTVISTKNTALAVKSTTTFGYGAGTPFKVAVTAGGVKLAHQTVTFKVNGNEYTKTTNSKGIASLPIDLEIGKYTVHYEVKKTSKINSKSGSADIIVKQRTGSTLTWKSGTSFTDSSQTIKVLLKDANGNPISGQTVKLTINSKTYTATTSSSGYAKIKASAPIGKYSVSVKFAGNNEYLPNSTSKTVSITSSNLAKGINEKNSISDLSKYLKSSSNCQVGNAKIKALVDSLTSGLTSEIDKAKAIFNYVRDHVSYAFYYNTKFGATGTLNGKKGNCVDHSHLLVAMFRTAGLAARYVHGKCTFSSGSTYGHVWAQVLIGDTWVAADATSSKNSLGKISNWNTKSYTYKGTYASLPF